jgi:hypothetical protein
MVPKNPMAMNRVTTAEAPIAPRRNGCRSIRGRRARKPRSANSPTRASPSSMGTRAKAWSSARPGSLASLWSSPGSFRRRAGWSGGIRQEWLEGGGERVTLRRGQSRYQLGEAVAAGRAHRAYRVQPRLGELQGLHPPITIALPAVHDSRPDQGIDHPTRRPCRQSQLVGQFGRRQFPVGAVQQVHHLELGQRQIEPVDQPQLLPLRSPNRGGMKRASFAYQLVFITDL